METSMFFGHTCHGALVPALLRASPHSSLRGVKHFFPVPVETTSTLGIFPQFNAMDSMPKAVQPPSVGFAPSTKRKQVSCCVCQLRFNSQSQASSHYKGTRHAKKLKALDSHKCTLRCSIAVAKETPRMTDVSSQSSAFPSPPALTPVRPPTSPSAPPTKPPQLRVHCTGSVLVREENQGPTELRPPTESDPRREAEPETGAEPEEETEEEKARRLLYCSLCKVAVNSTSQLEAHNSGTKHRTMLEARSGVGAIKSFPRVGVKSQQSVTCKPSSTGLQNKTFHCETCDVHVNSETQLKQHISSRRHKDRAAGKPHKPKYSPYSKAQKGTSKTPVKLLLVKDRQPLTAQMLPSQLAAVAAAIGTSFSHPTGHTPNPSQSPALFQTQPLPPTLLRHAPGPIRTPHPQVLFAPY